MSISVFKSNSGQTKEKVKTNLMCLAKEEKVDSVIKISIAYGTDRKKIQQPVFGWKMKELQTELFR